jgi:arylsulfatase A-like enzyme
MSPDLRAMFNRVTKGALSANAAQPAREEFKVNGEYVNTPDQGVVGIPFLDAYIEKAATDYLDQVSKSTPFFLNVNFMKVHQPNLPHPNFVHQSMSKSKYADSIVEADTRIGHIMDKVRALGLDKNTYVFWTTDNGAWPVAHVSFPPTFNALNLLPIRWPALLGFLELVERSGSRPDFGDRFGRRTY